MPSRRRVSAETAGAEDVDAGPDDGAEQDIVNMASTVRRMVERMATPVRARRV
jgi:hypothetical protein